MKNLFNVLVAFLGCIDLASASHFRFGTISWMSTGGNSIRFVMDTAWKRDYWPGTGDDGKVVTGDSFEVPSGEKGNEWYFGDSSPSQLLQVSITSPADQKTFDFTINNAKGTSTILHTYASPLGPEGIPWVAGYFGCCRLGARPDGDPIGTYENGLNNNGFLDWNVQTRIDLSAGPDGTIDRSPIAAGEAILNLRMDYVEEFDITAIDPDDDELTWRLSTALEMGGALNLQPGFGNNLRRDESAMTGPNKLGIETVIVVNNLGNQARYGVAQWDTNGLQTGYWQSTIMIGANKALIPIDFLMLLQDSKGNEPPFWVTPPTPALNAAVYVNCNQPLEYVMKAADPQESNEIEIFHVGAPPAGLIESDDVRMGVDGIANPLQRTANWTPTCAQAGKYSICYQARDNATHALTSRVRCVLITVGRIKNLPPKLVGATPISKDGVEPETGLCVGKGVEVNVEAKDENLNDVIDIIFTSETPKGAVISPLVYPNPQQRYHAKRSFMWNPEVDIQEDIRLCYMAKETRLINPLESPQQCLRITVRYAPAFVQPTPQPIAPKGPDNEVIGPVPECAQLVGYMGKELIFTVQAEDPNPEDSVFIFTEEDPGLPNGAEVLSNVCPENKESCNPVSRLYKWTPTVGQVGISYNVRFRARDNKNFCDPGGYYSLNDACITVTVVAPQPTWLPPTPANSVPMVTYVGCNLGFCLKAMDEMKVYDTNITVQTNGNGLPPGATLTGEQKGVTEGDKSTQRCFNWRPRHGQEGYLYEITFFAQDDGQTRFSKRSYKVDVVRCKVCAQTGDTLASIAMDYDLNWLAVWGANVDGAKNPDHLQFEQVVNLCPTYIVRKDDTLSNLAERFGSTPAHVLNMNPDITSSSNIRISQEICVCPGICNEYMARNEPYDPNKVDTTYPEVAHQPFLKFYQ